MTIGKEGLRTLLLNACPSLHFSNLCGFPNDCYNHNEIYKGSPKFFGNDGDSVTHHFDTFFKLVADFNVVHENDLMMIFSFSLNGDAKNWFYDLHEKFIISIVSFFECFLLRWCEFEVEGIKKLVKEYDVILPRTKHDSKKEIHNEPIEEEYRDLLIADIIEKSTS